MLPIPNRLYLIIGGTLLLLALVGGLWLRGSHWLGKFETLQAEAKAVVIAVRNASGNEDADWKTAPGQIVALGESNRKLKESVARQNEAVNELAREAVRLKARAAELKLIADRARSQRKAALERLSDMSITPGTREDCTQLLEEAEEALDLVRSAGI